jgi:hypothetical protein
MGSVLPYLYDSVPIMRSEILFAIGTLSVFLNELYNLALLNLSSLVNWPYEFNFDFHSFGMRLSPYEFSIFNL